MYALWLYEYFVYLVCLFVELFEIMVRPHLSHTHSAGLIVGLLQIAVHFRYLYLWQYSRIHIYIMYFLSAGWWSEQFYTIFIFLDLN